MLFVVGDIHGRASNLDKVVKLAEKNSVSAIIQVGDFGVLWPQDSTLAMDEYLKSRALRGNWSVPIFTCGGNHDNWAELNSLPSSHESPVAEIVEGSGCFFVKRGGIIELDGKSHLFLGGAESTDKDRRIDGLSWWENETPTRQEFEFFFEQFEKHKPYAVVTHEAPLRVKLQRARRNQNPTPNMLDNVLKLSEHRPRYWFFGHHHILEKWKIDGTKFYCCGLHGEYWGVEYNERNES